MAMHQTPLVLRIISVLFIAVLTIPMSGLSQLLYLCSMTGEIGPRCCCQHEAQDHDEKTVQVPSCCESVNTAFQSSSCRIQMKASQDQKTRMLATVAHVNVTKKIPALQMQDGVLGSRAPPKSTGPPIFIRCCSFLI